MAADNTNILVHNVSHAQTLVGKDFISCDYSDDFVSFKTIPFGRNPFDFALPTLFIHVILANLLSRLLYFFLKHLKQSRLFCNVLGGILLGPSLLGRNQNIMDKFYSPRQDTVLNLLAHIAVIYAMLVITIKLDVLTTLKTNKGCWRIGLTSLLSSFLTMGGLFLLFAHDIPGVRPTQFYVFFIVMTSVSTYPVAQASHQYVLTSSEFGQIAMSSAIVHDSISFAIAVLGLIFMKKRGEERTSVRIGVGASILSVFIFAIYVVRPALRSIAKRTLPGKPVEETYIILILLGTLILAAICDAIGMPYFDGAVIMGFIIPSGLPLGASVVEMTDMILREFLLPVLFIVVGMNTNIYAIKNWKAFALLQCVLVAGYLAKILGTMLASISLNIKLRASLLIALILECKGIIDLIFFYRMKCNKSVDEQVFAQLVLSVLVVNGIVNPLITNLYKPHSQNNQLVIRSQPHQTRAIQNTPVYAEFRIVCCVHEEEDVHGFITLLEALNPNPSSTICAYVVHLIELKGRALPILIPYKNHRRRAIFSSHTNTHHIMCAFENFSKNFKGPISIEPYINIAPYKSMHASTLGMAEEKLVPFLIIPFYKSERLKKTKTALRRQYLSMNFQHHAKCTVGILVNKGSNRYKSITTNYCPFYAAVIFIGGEDDREALALGTRMSGNVNVSITLLRIVLRKNEEDGDIEKERKLDECLLEDFKVKNSANDRAFGQEIVVDDGPQALEAIMQMEEWFRQFDLVLVGKRHNIIGLQEQEDSSFIENRELGVIGDMLGGADFGNGKLSVLVLHHWNEGRKCVKLGDDSSNYLKTEYESTSLI